MVALHTVDRRVDDFNGGTMLLEDAVADTLNGELASVGIADDTALANVLAAGFELGLDKDDCEAVPGLV